MENFQHANGEPLQVTLDAGFDAYIARAEAVDVAGTAVRVVRTDDLLAMKRRARG